MFSKIRLMAPYVFLLTLSFLTGCYVGPESPLLSYSGDTEHRPYKFYPGKELPESEVVTIVLTDAYYAVIDGFKVAKTDYEKIHMLPGKHEILWGKWFAFSVTVEPSMWGKGEGSAVMDFLPGHTYELYADRTHGHGYKMYFWMQDAETGEVVNGTKKP